MTGLTLPAALAVALAMTVSGCSDDPGERAAPEPEPVALADLDTAAMAVQRDAFCDAVDDEALDAAVGTAGEPQTWGNGENVTLGDGSEDLAHENGCRWGADDAVQGAAWVYVPPVPLANAEAYVEAAGAVEGCEPLEQPAYGTPSVALRCVGATTTEISFRGLFGDAWLTCTLSEPTADLGDDLADRASAWCAAVAVAAAE